jgi:hypothetical protein
VDDLVTNHRETATERGQTICPVVMSRRFDHRPEEEPRIWILVVGDPSLVLDLENRFTLAQPDPA